ncbi:hypothetical protein L7F22_058558 [Adiantum nelumboides]|nr:hypothetical protein [Adiantum nelumboides]
MAEETAALLNSPTWAIACTCAVFIIISLIAERAIFYIGRLALNYSKAALMEAFEKLKEELIMVGFISIALTVGQNWFSKLCVPTKWSTIMLLCVPDAESNSTEEANSSCKEDHVLFMPAESIHQLHILMFILALVHVVYTVVIVALGMWVVSHWKAWEQRAATKELLSTHGGIRIVRDTSFVRARAATKWRKNPILAYVIVSFIQRVRQNFSNGLSYRALETSRQPAKSGDRGSWYAQMTQWFNTHGLDIEQRPPFEYDPDSPLIRLSHEEKDWVLRQDLW